MARCNHCGNECILPFTCQHCGGRYCPDCRLPPSHDCAGIRSWNARPRPAAGMNYRWGGQVTATGGGTPAIRKRRSGRTAPDHLFLRLLVAIAVLILIGLAWLALTGYRL